MIIQTAPTIRPTRELLSRKLTASNYASLLDVCHSVLLAHILQHSRDYISLGSSVTYQDALYTALLDKLRFKSLADLCYYDVCRRPLDLQDLSFVSCVWVFVGSYLFFHRKSRTFSKTVLRFIDTEYSSALTPVRLSSSVLLPFGMQGVSSLQLSFQECIAILEPLLLGLDVSVDLKTLFTAHMVSHVDVRSSEDAIPVPLLLTELGRLVDAHAHRREGALFMEHALRVANRIVGYSSSSPFTSPSASPVKSPLAVSSTATSPAVEKGSPTVASASPSTHVPPATAQTVQTPPQSRTPLSLDTLPGFDVAFFRRHISSRPLLHASTLPSNSNFEEMTHTVQHQWADRVSRFVSEFSTALDDFKLAVQLKIREEEAESARIVAQTEEDRMEDALLAILQNAKFKADLIELVTETRAEFELETLLNRAALVKQAQQATTGTSPNGSATGEDHFEPEKLRSTSREGSGSREVARRLARLNE